MRIGLARDEAQVFGDKMVAFIGLDSRKAVLLMLKLSAGIGQPLSSTGGANDAGVPIIALGDHERKQNLVIVFRGNSKIDA